MSPNLNKLSLKKSSSSVYGCGHGSSGRGSCGNGRNQPPSRSGYVAQDLNAKQFNNKSIKVYNVIPGNKDMTKSLLLATISKNHFIVGSNYEATHNTIKQTVFDIFINSLSTVFTIESKLKEAFHAIIDLHYNGRSISNNTFRFSPPTGPSLLMRSAIPSSFLKLPTTWYISHWAWVTSRYHAVPSRISYLSNAISPRRSPQQSFPLMPSPSLLIASDTSPSPALVTIEHPCKCSQLLYFNLQTICGLFFTELLIAPTKQEHTSPNMPTSPDDPTQSYVDFEYVQGPFVPINLGTSTHSQTKKQKPLGITIVISLLPLPLTKHSQNTTVVGGHSGTVTKHV